jgi:hypothetical protein
MGSGPILTPSFLSLAKIEVRCVPTNSRACVRIVLSDIPVLLWLAR